MLMRIYRCAVVAAMMCLCVMAAGCADVGSRAPFGTPVKLDDKDSAAAEMLDTLYSRVWVTENEKGLGIMRFSAVNNDRSTLRMTVVSEEDGAEAKKDAETEQTYDCLMRAWDGRLILNKVVDEAKEENKTWGKYRGLYLLWFEKDEAGNQWVCGIEPSSEALKKTRKTADGKEVKLELLETPRKGNGGSIYTITSSEAEIQAYLSACKPEDVYEIRDGEKKKEHKFAKGTKVNMNYKGRPEFRKRVDEK